MHIQTWSWRPDVRQKLWGCNNNMEELWAPHSGERVSDIAPPGHEGQSNMKFSGGSARSWATSVRSLVVFVLRVEIYIGVIFVHGSEEQYSLSGSATREQKYSLRVQMYSQNFSLCKCAP